jgi:hypothetical protein
MNEHERNLRIAQKLQRDFTWNGTTLQEGDFVALLDGQIIAVTANAEAAIAALRARAPDPKRGMVIEVSPPAIDVIRQVT